ncbi:hypothetical protein [Accumulibacter sp.]|uniref:hypothetical protein n=1 Tax=Accumulibacter sp. TaxID=2053492 RepID=UPI0028C49B28|nr:hypothetical protein [Accumulibacter sp.]
MVLPLKASGKNDKVSGLSWKSFPVQGLDLSPDSDKASKSLSKKEIFLPSEAAPGFAGGNLLRTNAC